MAVTYGFYDSVAGDRVYNAAQMGAIFNGIITDGVFAAVGGAFVVSQNSPTAMSVLVASGRAWFNGTWTYNDATVVRTVEASEAVLNRIDTVCFEINFSTRANSIKIVKGTPASSPVAPTLTNTSTVKQYAMANISVAAGVTTITNANITNRIGTTGAPFITGPLQVLDLTALLNQYGAQFDLWLANLTNQLTSGQASNLQNQIDSIVTGWLSTGETWTYISADAPNYVIQTTGDKTSKYQPGFRFKITQTTVRYFIIVKVALVSGNTQLTVFGGTHSIVDNLTISNPQYSTFRLPFGLPANKEQWSVTVQDTTQRVTTGPTANTWSNPGALKITVPIGNWRLYWSGSCQIRMTTAGTAVNAGFQGTLSTSSDTTTESHPVLTARYTFAFPNTLTNGTGRAAFFKEMPYVNTTKQDFFAKLLTGASGAVDIEFPNHIQTMVMVAECALF